MVVIRVAGNSGSGNWSISLAVMGVLFLAMGVDALTGPMTGLRWLGLAGLPAALYLLGPKLWLTKAYARGGTALTVGLDGVHVPVAPDEPVGYSVPWSQVRGISLLKDDHLTPAGRRMFRGGSRPGVELVLIETPKGGSPELRGALAKRLMLWLVVKLNPRIVDLQTDGAVFVLTTGPRGVDGVLTALRHLRDDPELRERYCGSDTVYLIEPDEDGQPRFVPAEQTAADREQAPR